MKSDILDFDRKFHSELVSESKFAISTERQMLKQIQHDQALSSFGIQG